MMKISRNALFLLTLAVLFPINTALAQEPTPPDASLVLPTPAEIIDAVNSLRLAYGIAPLAVHPVLMQIAQEEAYGIASGLEGHWRPNNMTLGQWMMSLGYPLLGDLSQDGYRSENWIVADTAQDAVYAWLSDDPHTNTMLSTERSDIGAGVASNDDGIYVVIETAWQTSSGRLQSNAYPTLTALAGAPQNINSTTADDSLQYMQPVALNTPFPNGEVYHEVQYGQTLWSIAINYHTTIKRIQQLNNLPDTTIRQGQKLLVARDVTQVAPTATLVLITLSATPFVALAPSTRTPSPTPTLQPLFTSSDGNKQENLLGLGAITFAGIVLAGIFTIMLKRKN